MDDRNWTRSGAPFPGGRLPIWVAINGRGLPLFDHLVGAGEQRRWHRVRSRFACRAEDGNSDWPALGEVECLDARSAFIAQPNRFSALGKSALLMRFDEGKTAVALAQEVCRS